ncbi:MAG: molybdenum cofactor guanylyltransferase [Janthinobacterium lividum]
MRGYVLAGGESSRMQRPDLPQDKALLLLGGQTLLERALATLAHVCPEPQILCGSKDRCARLRHLGPTLVDEVLLAGPLGGLHAALADARKHEAAWALITPVDLPRMSAALLHAFVQAGQCSGAGVACLRAVGIVQPLPVLLHTSAEPFLRTALHAGERKLRPVLQGVAKQIGDCSGIFLTDVETFGFPAEAAEACFRNLNTPDDFDGAQQDETLRTGLHQSKHGG